jgi:hypothetical protein
VPDRTLYAEFTTGSKLYGSATDKSDTDLVRLWYPTLAELVGNGQVTISQRFHNGYDVRGLLLGDFVMSLGKNNENTLLAMHYADEYFEGIDPNWYVSAGFVKGLINTADSMMRFAKTSKVYAHGYRYLASAEAIMNGSRDPYPMAPEVLERYMEIRADEEPPTWAGPSIDLLDRASSEMPTWSVDTGSLAEWTWQAYQRFYGNGDVER